MSRRLLLIAGGKETPPPPVDPPPDPALTHARTFTTCLAMNQNVTGASGEGATWRNTFEVLEDSASLRMVFNGSSQGSISDPMTLKVSIESEDGTLTPVTFDGEALAAIPLDGHQSSGVITGPFLQGSRIVTRVHAPPGQTVNLGGSPYAIGSDSPGDQTATPGWTPGPYGSYGPTPLAFIGQCRSRAISPAVLGDSIAAQQLWWTDALNEHRLPGINYGRNVMTFGESSWIVGTIEAVTHLLVEFGANDLGSAPTVAFLWAKAVGCYDYIQTLKPGLPLWQTTTTPIANSSNDCATLEGQTIGASGIARLPWNEFLRDGAPCGPATREALAVGAEGLRAGDPGHPLRGIVDVAAPTEEGGAEAPTGKWLPGPNGEPISDGIHPGGIAMSRMVAPTSAWLATLTAG